MKVKLSFLQFRFYGQPYLFFRIKWLKNFFNVPGRDAILGRFKKNGRPFKGARCPL